jgi:hypothetical protein
MEYLGLYNKPTAEMHPGHKLTGPTEEDFWRLWLNRNRFGSMRRSFVWQNKKIRTK